MCPGVFFLQEVVRRGRLKISCLVQGIEESVEQTAVARMKEIKSRQEA